MAKKHKLSLKNIPSKTNKVTIKDVKKAIKNKKKRKNNFGTLDSLKDLSINKLVDSRISLKELKDKGYPDKIIEQIALRKINKMNKKYKNKKFKKCIWTKENDGQIQYINIKDAIYCLILTWFSNMNTSNNFMYTLIKLLYTTVHHLNYDDETAGYFESIFEYPFYSLIILYDGEEFPDVNDEYWTDNFYGESACTISFLSKKELINIIEFVYNISIHESEKIIDDTYNKYIKTTDVGQFENEFIETNKFKYKYTHYYLFYLLKYLIENYKEYYLTLEKKYKILSLISEKYLRLIWLVMLMYDTTGLQTPPISEYKRLTFEDIMNGVIEKNKIFFL